LVKKYPGECPPKYVRAHLNKFMHAGFVAQGHTDLRTKLNSPMDHGSLMKTMKEIALELAERRKDVAPIEKITWYYRHWREAGDDAKFGLINKDKLPKSNIQDANWNEWMGADPRNP
jgi:hypothetical protein